MAFRNVMIESDARISVKNEQLVITEKQFSAIEILLGRLTEADESFQGEQLSIF